MHVADPNGRINAAIRECLDLCYRSPAPSACLAEYLKALAVEREWSTTDVAGVRSRVIRILRSLTVPEDDEEPFGFAS
jgi:hypothetical protein